MSLASCYPIIIIITVVIIVKLITVSIKGRKSGVTNGPHIGTLFKLWDATVNHSVNFVDPGTGLHTNSVENLWRCAKDKFKRMHGTSDAHIASYLDEFLWRHRHGSRDVCFNNAVELMRWHYPVPL